MAPDWRVQYASQISYLEEKSRKGELTASNSVYQEMKGKTSLPDLQRWLSTLRVNY